jgi:spermidine synthase
MRWVLFSATSIIAFCSLTYEFVIAQSLSAVTGSTFIRYNLTIAIFLASLGLGALFVKKVPVKVLWQQLLRIELALSILGPLFAPLLLITDRYLSAASLILAYGLMVTIGFISGFELPILIYLAQEGKKDNQSYWILSADYFGIFVASVLFPIFLLPKMGLFSTSILAGLLSAAVTFWIAFRIKTHRYLILSTFLILVWALMIFKDDVVSKYLINHIYLDGFIK